MNKKLFSLILLCFFIYLKRVSADLEGPANTNLLFVLCVRNGLIILFTAKYHHGTLINTYKPKSNKTKIKKLNNLICI